MEILRLKLENFWNHISTDLDFTSFRSAVIIGHNKQDPRDANGVGKTAIFLAIEYALFGEFPTKTIDKIVRDGAQICKVLLEFKNSQGTFQIIRSRNKKTSKSDLVLKKWQNENWTDLTQKTSSEVEIELHKIVKITHKAFRNCILFPQQDLTGLTSGTSESRKALFKEILDLVIYSKLEKSSKEKLQNFSQELSSLKKEIAVLGNPTQEIQELTLLITQNKSEISLKESQYEELKNQLAQDIIELDEREKCFQYINGSLQKDLSEIVKKKNSIQQSLSVNKQNLQEKNKSRNDLCNELNLKNVQLEKLNVSLKTLKKFSFLDLEELKKKLEDFSSQEIVQKTLLATLKLQIKDLQTPLPSGELCSQCRQTITSEHRENCQKKIKENLLRLEQECQDVQDKINSLQKEKQFVSKEINTVQVNQQEIISLSNKIEVKNKEIPLLKMAEQQTSEIIIKLETEVKNNHDIFEEISKKEQELRSKLDEDYLKDLDLKYKELYNKVDANKKLLSSVSKSVVNLTSQIEVFEEKIKLKKENLIKLEQFLKLIQELEKKIYVQTLVIESFGSQGIPKMIIHTLLDDLQIETNKLLNKVKPGLELFFSEDLEITYLDQGKKRELEQLSGGQKFSIALTQKMGLSLVIQHRLGVEIKILELDEVDQPLSKMALDSLVYIIKEWQKDFQILIITHNDELKSKFETAILVENDGVNGATGKVISL